MLTAFFLLLVSALLYAFGIMPLYTAAVAKNAHLTHLKGLLADGEKLHERRDALLEIKSGIPLEKRELLEQTIVKYTSEEVVKFVIAFDQLLGRSALGRSTPFSIGSGSTQPDNVVAIPFVFNFDAINYGLLLDFVDTLRQWERGLRITSVQISGSSERSAAGDVRAVIETEGLFSAVTDTL